MFKLQIDDKRHLNGGKREDLVSVFERSDVRDSVEQKAIVLDEGPAAEALVHQMNLPEVFGGIGEDPFEMLEIQRVDLLPVARVVHSSIFARLDYQQLKVRSWGECQIQF